MFQRWALNGRRSVAGELEPPPRVLTMATRPRRLGGGGGGDAAAAAAAVAAAAACSEFDLQQLQPRP